MTETTNKARIAEHVIEKLDDVAKTLLNEGKADLAAEYSEAARLLRESNQCHQ
jgi:hypothetical protein